MTGWQDGARLSVRFRDAADALAKLRSDYGATGYDGKGPPTQTEVGVRKSYFATLPEGLMELLLVVQPEKLSFYCEKLAELPAGIPSHSPSRRVFVNWDISSSVVLIHSLSEGFGEQLVNLTDFNLHGCVKLQELPESICNMRSLTKLDLSGEGEYGCGPMSIRALPERFGQLRSLVELDLRYCQQLRALPEGIPPRFLPLTPLLLGMNCA